MSDIVQKERDLSPADDALARAYARTGVPTDVLPYTDTLKALHSELAEHFKSESDLLRRLFLLRKSGRLPRVGYTGSAAPKVEPDVAECLSDIVTHHLKSIGMRDQLPYSPLFETVKREFEQRTGIIFSNQELWRLISNLAK